MASEQLVETKPVRLSKQIQSQEGSLLLEVTIASALAVILLMAVALSFGSAARGARESRVRQEATTIVSEQIDLNRSLAWNELAMSSVDRSAPYVDNSGRFLEAGGAGIPTSESLVAAGVGLVDPVQVVVVDEVDYTIWTYVTSPEPSLRRVVVIAEWQVGEPVEQHASSTLVSTVSTS